MVDNGGDEVGGFEDFPEGVDGGDGSEFAIREIEAGAEDFLEGLIRPPRMAGSPFGLRLRLRPKRLRSLSVFRWRF